MAKAIFLILLLFLAYGLAVIMLRRLTQTTKQLGDLREQIARNDSKLSDQLQAVHLEQEKLQKQLEANKK